MRVRLRGRRLLRLRHFGAQALQLLVERGLVGEQRRELLVALAQPRFERAATVRQSALGRGVALRQRGRIEREPGRRPRGAAVGTREPVGHVEQLAHGHQRVVRRDRAVAVHRAVAERVDDPRLAEHRLARGLLEARLVDQRREVVLIGQLERGVVLVGPAHRQLQRAPGIEAGRARVGVDGRLGLEQRRRTRQAIRAGGRRTGSPAAPPESKTPQESPRFARRFGCAGETIC